MRKDISIYVKVNLPGMEYDMEEWQLLDVGNLSLTLDYISNILSDIGSITSSRTFTVKLPRTVHNDKVLDLAVVPQYESNSRYKYLPCKCYVNDIDVMGDAFLYLLDSEATNYQCCIVFGLLQYYRAWIDAGKSIKKLANNGQYINWNQSSAFQWSEYVSPLQPPIIHAARWYGDDANINTYTPANGLGKLMHFGIYYPGFERTNVTVEFANVHPFVTMREIWERIISENNLNFVLPNDVKLDMEDLAIVLTTISGNTAQGNANQDVNIGSGDRPYSNKKSAASTTWFWNIICQNHGDCYSNGITNYNAGTRKSKILYKGDSNLDMIIELDLADNSSFSYNGGHHSASYILNDKGHMEYMNLYVYIYSTQETITITPTYTANGILWSGRVHIPCWSRVEGEAVADVWIDNDTRICNDIGNGIWNTYWFGGNRAAWDQKFQWNRCLIEVVWYDGTHNYPNPYFRLFPNLPDIKQVDFVKFVCQLYGLFPVVNPATSDQIEFVHFDSLIENEPKASDWSNRLLEDDADAPKKISMRLGDFAQRNMISYKQDEHDPVSDRIRTGVLFVNDLTLEKDKELITFPLAASEDNTINQYYIKVETDNETDPPTVTYEAEFTECVHRLMRVISWYNYANKTVTELSFSGLSVPEIIEKYYSTYQAYIEKPRLITERVRLLETELKALDMRIPVYLSKYGRYFAIKDIKWTVGNDYAECELLML